VVALWAAYQKKACLQKTRAEKRRRSKFDKDRDNHIAFPFRTSFHYNIILEPRFRIAFFILHL